MLLTETQLRKLLRKMIVENQQYIPKLIKLITSNDFQTVLQGIDLAETIDMVEILEQSTSEPDTSSIYGTRIYHQYILRVKEPMFSELEAAKRTPNNRIFFLFIRDDAQSGRVEISHVERVRK